MGYVMPVRIQMSRNRPWRAEHPDAVIVDRRSRWGNPFVAFDDDGGPSRAVVVERYRGLFTGATRWPYPHVPQPTREQVRMALAGRDLACWCPLDGPCHADVLLAIANGGDE